MNYTYFYKSRYHSPKDVVLAGRYDVLISAYSHDDRVILPWNYIDAARKIWIVNSNSPNLDKKPSGEDFVLNDLNSFEEVKHIVDTIKLTPCMRICVDSTGFVIPVLYMLIKSFQLMKILSFDVIYSEPQKYKFAEGTDFSEDCYDVSQIFGYAGTHIPDMSRDLLIVASGYDDQRICDVANDKKSAKKVQLIGFPSLQADMYQENLIKACNAESALGSDCITHMENNIFSPAYDPFVTAQAISDYLNEKQAKKPFSNIYFAPLSTKPHALGIALFYLCEGGHHQAMSVLYPLCKNYITETTDGVGNVWKYTFKIPSYQ